MNLPPISIVTIDPEQPRKRSPQDVLDELRETERNIRESRAFVRAAMAYSPEEMAFVAKMKGGLLPRDQAVGQLKQMMQEDLNLAFQQFIGGHVSPMMKQQIEAATREVQDVYNKVFEALGFQELIKIEVTMRPEDNIIDIKAIGGPCPQTP